MSNINQTKTNLESIYPVGSTEKENLKREFNLNWAANRISNHKVIKEQAESLIRELTNLIESLENDEPLYSNTRISTKAIEIEKSVNETIAKMDAVKLIADMLK